MENIEKNIIDETNLVPLQGLGGISKVISFEQCDFENPTHLEALANLLNQYMADPMGGAPQLTKLQQLRLVDGLANNAAAFVQFVLVEDEIVGMATCFVLFSTFNVKSYLNIHDFFIVPTYRGKGLANALMQELIALSTTRKYCKITLEVREDNLVAQGLYKSVGFDECDPKMLFWTKKMVDQ